jgi:hypothetical protein
MPRRTQPNRLLRRLAFVAAIPFSVATVVLLLADRSPDYALAAAGRIWRGGPFLQGRIGIDLLDRSDIPLAFDTAGHIALWFGAAVLARVLANGSISSRRLAAILVTLSLALELSQGVLTSSRHVQVVDGLANGVGVALGFTVMAVLAAVTSRSRRVQLRSHSLTG